MSVNVDPKTHDNPKPSQVAQRKRHKVTPSASFLRILTYNTHLFGNSLAALLPHATQDEELRADAIAQWIENFDIIGLQEAFSPYFLTALQQKEDYYSYLAPKAEGKAMGPFPKLLPSGLALLSRYPLLDCQRFHFKDTAGPERFVDRGVLCASLSLSSKGTTPTFSLFVTHTHWGGEDLASREIRMKNLLQLREIIDTYCQKQKNPAYLLLGDLNLIQTSADYGALLALFPDCADATADHHPTCDPTANQLLQTFHPTYAQVGKTKIDYILYTKNHFDLIYSQVAKPKCTHDPHQDLSDHYPLMAHLCPKN